MALGLITVSLLLLLLGLVQAWTVWYLRREVARLEQRLDESLDDQDLLDFQSRLQTLMEQAKDTGIDLVQTVQRRQEALEKSLTLVRDAEKRLAARAQIMDKAVESAAAKAQALSDKAKRGAKKAVAPQQKTPPAPSKPAVSGPPVEGTPSEEKSRERSYLLRPQAPIAVPAPGSRNQKVYEAADRGLDREQIARETGMLPGEIDLILNLRPKKRG
jgi:hypothetical protein